MESSSSNTTSMVVVDGGGEEMSAAEAAAVLETSTSSLTSPASTDETPTTTTTSTQNNNEQQPHEAENESVKTTTTTNNNNDDNDKLISESTLMISSMTNTDQNESAAAAAADDDDDDKTSNTQSMVVVQQQSPEISSSTLMTMSVPPPPDTTTTNNTVDVTSSSPPKSLSQSQTSDVDRLLVNDYEIPTFDSATAAATSAEITAKTEQLKADIEEASSSTSPTTTTTTTTTTTSKRRLEDETYQEILGNSSLLKKITQYGVETGTEFSRRPMAGQMVTISYEAYIHDNSTTARLVDHNDNLNFILGDGDVIAGLDMVVSLMDKDEKCEMIAESRHAYGSLGKQPDIPPNATLLYKIHLKDFNDVTDMNSMSPIERLSLADAKKLRGNFHYNRQDFHLAVMSYKKGLVYFNEENLRGDELDEDVKKFAEIEQALSMNLALSYYKLGECREALQALDQVIRVKSNHVKAFYIKGKILLQMGETEEAIKSLNQALQFEPENADVKKELAKAQTKYKIQYENEKKMYKKMISAAGGSNGDSSKQATTSRGGKSSGGDGDKSSSHIFTYLATGVAIAVASVGIAWLARYRNII